MELVIQILILFIFFNTILKLSFWKWWQALIFGLICAIFVIWTQRYAVIQSKTQLYSYLANRQNMQDLAVLITFESVIYFTFCFTALKDMFGLKKTKWIQILYWYPGFLLFPALFYLLTQANYLLSGINFNTTAKTMGIVMFFIIPAASYGIKLLEPDKVMRLELHFLVSLFVGILGLLTTVDGNIAYAAVEEPLNFKAILYSVLLFLILFITGFWWSRYKWSIGKNNHRKK